MNDMVVLDREMLFMMLGEFALPRDDTDCAPIAQELINQVNQMEWWCAIVDMPKNWYCIFVGENPID